MTERDINTYILAALLLFIMFTIGCGEKEKTHVKFETSFCSVSTSGQGDTIVSCPDGTEVIIPPQVIESETVVQVPVIVNIPVHLYCKKKSSHCGHKH